MYNVYYVANYIIEYCNKKNIPISNLKLQKLLYFVQASFLVNKNMPCFEDDFVAWDFGPVVPAIYHKYKSYGSSNIYSYYDMPYDYFKHSDALLIDEMLDSCAKYSAAQLVDITHRQSPWLDAYSPYHGNVISQESIKSFFAEP